MLQEYSNDIVAYAEVILPLSLHINYTYGIPAALQSDVSIGKRVEIQFGQRKIYAGIVKRIHHDKPEPYSIKPILSVLDEAAIVTEVQLKFWEWMAGYYLCTEGDVMNAALPGGFKLESETIIMLHPAFDGNYTHLSDKEYLVAEALHVQKELSIEEIGKILRQKTVYPLVQSLLRKNVVLVKEQLLKRYKPKTATYIRINPFYEKDDQLRPIFDELEKKAPKQLALLMAYTHLSNLQGTRYKEILKSDLLEKAKSDHAALQALLKKNILLQQQKETGRINDSDAEKVTFELTAAQQTALDACSVQATQKHVTLLHGVTGSGKTNVYIRLMEDAIAEGKQVLYLLPEIALTTQIIERLRGQFGKKIGIYHSRFNQQERVEIWNKLLLGEYQAVLGARSALFLPFNHLGLVIVDEEHDSSYKQNDPAPRYNGRDAAILLAGLHGAKVFLGSATPSLESYQHTASGKFGLVELNERYAGLEMPEIMLADVKEAKKKKQLHGHFTTMLLEELKTTIDQKEQAILFQNRRGYAPYMECETCGWTAMCPNCDVHLTYHKFQHELKCHYCGHRKNSFAQCPACGSSLLKITGFGTEKIEDDLKVLLPGVAVARLDYDAVKSKNGYQKIIGDFERNKTKVLVGTQMVTKGLDFANVSLVGILNADQLLNNIDFRSAERGFQLMSQVSGRPGRKNKRGRVIIQTGNINNTLLPFIIHHDYRGFYLEEIRHRQKFQYPPFTRLIQLTFKHKDKKTVWEAGQLVANGLQKDLQKRLLGPAEPPVARIKNQYLVQILIKLERQSAMIEHIKIRIREALRQLEESGRYRSVHVITDVDPY
ncbi:MAG: primosomal protein N' [Chitinophagales bacterium]|nr:primosomal protein N' [Chitinophagales bacterium]